MPQFVGLLISPNRDISIIRLHCKLVSISILGWIKGAISFFFCLILIVHENQKNLHYFCFSHEHFFKLRNLFFQIWPIDFHFFQKK